MNENIYSKHLLVIDEGVKKSISEWENYDGSPFPNHFNPKGIYLIEGVYVIENQRKECKHMEKSIYNCLELIVEENENNCEKERWYRTLCKVKIYKYSMCFNAAGLLFNVI